MVDERTAPKVNFGPVLSKTTHFDAMPCGMECQNVTLEFRGFNQFREHMLNSFWNAENHAPIMQRPRPFVRYGAKEIIEGWWLRPPAPSKARGHGSLFHARVEIRSKDPHELALAIPSSL